MSQARCYDLRKENKAQLAFVNTVAENKLNFTKRQIKGAEVARFLYATLGRPSMKDFKWIRVNMTVSDWDSCLCAEAHNLTLATVGRWALRSPFAALERTQTAKILERVSLLRFTSSYRLVD